MRMNWTWAGVTLLWTLGLAVLLGVISIAYYRSSVERSGLLNILKQKAYLLAADCGAALFLAGIWMTGASIPQKLVLTAGGVWLGVETWLAWRRK